MNIHEYQTKELLRQYGVPVPKGRVAHSDAQAVAIAEEIDGERWVIKAQIHAGGRGKGGGVQLANTHVEVQEISDRMIGSRLVTAQTGAEGKCVQRVLVEEAMDIGHEYYIGFVIDRASQRVTVIASDSGGMDIEEVSRTDPDRVVRETVDPAVGLLDFQCRKIASRIGLSGKQIQALVKVLKGLYRCFRDNDATLAEINPLACVGENLVALDAKMSFDDNALYRRPAITGLRDFDEEDPKEVDAGRHNLSYIALDGTVGCIVNGAGLAMATMDAIVLHGGRPANFLDVGGGASPEKIANAFRIVLADENIRAVLVNIFAGINRCDWVAAGLVQAMKEHDIQVPVVARLAGTNAEEGNRILDESGLRLIRAGNLDDAAAKVIATERGIEQ